MNKLSEKTHNVENVYNKLYTLEKHLYSFDAEKKIQEKYKFFRERISEVLQETKRAYPNYSLHDSSHSETIIRNIEKILGEENISKMTFSDTLFILYAAYLHDIGMVLTYKQIENIINNKDFIKDVEDKFSENDLKNELEYLKKQNKKIENINLINGEIFRKAVAEFNRKEHGKGAAKFLKENLEEFNIDLSIDHSGLLEHLGEICQAHQSYSYDEILKRLEPCVDGIEGFLHPRFLAFLLRVGDLLDLDCDRFSKDLLIINGPLRGISKMHYLKHSSIKKVLINKKNIDVKAVLEDFEALQPLREWKKYLKQEIDFINDNHSEIIPEKIDLILPKPKFIISREDAEEEYANEDLDVKFPEKKVYEFIKGESIYNDKMVFLREIYQNALDSLKIRYWLDKKDEYLSENIGKKYDKEKLLEAVINDYYKEGILEKYKIDFICYDGENQEELKELEDLYNDQKYGRVKKEFEGKIICVLRDTGIGISKNAFENRVIEVGRHENEKDEVKKIIEEMPNFLKPTSSFGLGLHSIFTITDTLIIKTKALGEEGNGRNIIIKDVPNIGRVIGEEKRKIKEKKEIQGTTIFIPIDKSKIQYFYNEFENKWRVGKYFSLDSNMSDERDYIIGFLEVAFSEYIKYDKLKFRVKIHDEKNRNKEENGVIDNLFIEIEKDENYGVTFKKIEDETEFFCFDKKRGHSLSVNFNGIKNKMKIYYKDIFLCNTGYYGSEIGRENLDRFCDMAMININFSFEDASLYIPASRDTIKSDKIGECIGIIELLMYQLLVKIKKFLSNKENLEKLFNKEDKLENIEKYWRYRDKLEENLELENIKKISHLSNITKNMNKIRNFFEIEKNKESEENSIFTSACLDILEEGISRSPHFRFLSLRNEEYNFKKTIKKLKEEIKMNSEKTYFKTKIDTIMLTQLLIRYGLISDEDKELVENLKKLYGINYEKNKDKQFRNLNYDSYFESLIFKNIEYLSKDMYTYVYARVKPLKYMPIDSIFKKGKEIYIKYFDNNSNRDVKIINTGELDSLEALIFLIESHYCNQLNKSIPVIEEYKELAVKELPPVFNKFNIKPGNYPLIIPDIGILNTLLNDKVFKIPVRDLIWNNTIVHRKIDHLIVQGKDLKINLFEIFEQFKEFDISETGFNELFKEKELNIKIEELNKYIEYVYTNQVKMEGVVYSKENIEIKYKKLIIELTFAYIYTLVENTILRKIKHAKKNLGSLNKTNKKRCNYKLLKKYLEKETKKTVVLTYDKIGEIVGCSLPKYALKEENKIKETLLRYLEVSKYCIFRIDLGEKITFKKTK